MDTKEPLQFDVNYKKTKCGWCGNLISKKYRDGLPSFCSDSCGVNAQPDKTITKNVGKTA